MTDENTTADLTHGHYLPWDDATLTVDSDPKRRARYRRLQSWYHHHVPGVGGGLGLRHMTLSELTDRAAKQPRLAEWAGRFRQRYCEFLDVAFNR